MINTTSLRLNKDFRRVYSRSRSRVHPFMVTYAMKNGRPFCRIGITASKKVGKAVRRNRARRLVREAYRLFEPCVPPGWDIVFVIRKAMTNREIKMRDVAAVMERHIKALTAPRK